MTDRTGDPPAVADLVDQIRAGTEATGDAVDLLDALAAADPGRLDRALDDVETILIDDGGDVALDDRLAALGVVADFATRHPEHAPAVVSTIAAALADPALEANTLRALARITAAEPTAVDPHLDAVGRRLVEEPVPTRWSALRVLVARAETDPAAVAPLASRLSSTVVAATDRDPSAPALPEHQRSRRYDQRVAEERLGKRAAALLADVATAAPDAIAPELDCLGPVLAPGGDRTVPVRERVLAVVRAVAQRAPGSALAARDPLLATVESGDDPAPLRADAAGTVATLADADLPAATEPARSAIPSLGDLLTDEDPAVRANAASLLSYVAQRHPREVGLLTDALVERLDDEHPPVRAAVVWTLGFVDTGVARDALEDAAATDPDPEIRTLAAEMLTAGSPE